MKKIVIMAVITGIALLATGCGNKVLVSKPYEKTYDGEEMKVYTEKLDLRDGRSLLRSSDAERSATVLLERVARNTLASGNKYFAIWAPYAVSNFKGSTVNTWESFKQQCFEGGAGSTGSMVDAFGVGQYACGMAATRNPNISFVDYVMYKQPNDQILVWDAQKLLDDLKKDGVLNEAGWEEYDEKANPDGWRFKSEYRHWVKDQRAK